jgi:two-component system cell cycle response regulator
MVDLDNFKSINDNYGHFDGDAVLCEAARRMQVGIRQYDAIGRYGGEEFLILLTGCDEEASWAQAERLRKQLTQMQMSLQESSIGVTASFGVTTALPGQSWTPEDLIHRADEALYIAKRRGRNRVEFLPHKDSQPIAASAVESETAVL